MTDYKLSRRASVCMGCERTYDEGESIVSAIYAPVRERKREDEPEEFVRRDVCERCFAGDADAYSFWRARQPVAPEERRRLDFDLAFEFLARLLREADPEREGITYLLTLLLSRKRRVKIKETRILPEGELLSVIIPSDEEDQLVQIRAPRLTEEDATRLQADLDQLLGLSDRADDSDAPQPSESAPSDVSGSGDSVPAETA